MGVHKHGRDSGNLFASIPTTLPTELFETLLEHPGCRLERIVSRGHSTPEGQWYDQAWDEWVLLIKGKATLELEEHPDPIQMESGDYLLLPAHQRHRVTWTDPAEDTIWLALHLTNTDSGKQNI
jgi:cupin 2 domain-containing protein